MITDVYTFVYETVAVSHCNVDDTLIHHVAAPLLHLKALGCWKQVTKYRPNIDHNIHNGSRALLGSLTPTSYSRLDRSESDKIRFRFRHI